MHVTPAAPRRLAGLRMLLVDDEPDARAVVSELLQLEGAQVCVCESAALAYEKLTAPNCSFDALVSDIGMPQEDGYSLVRRLRAAGGNRILAVALTGLASSQDALAAREAGFDLHVPKPIDIDSFVAALPSLPPGATAAPSVASARHAAAP